ncbi:hypothetical protein SAMN04488504_107299 [Myxococcus virescens]|nr:hypothetical protein SAMN04488504_107299 [Myxococcus virescens]
MRGVLGIKRRWRKGTGHLGLDFKLISRQSELGSLGAYLSSLRAYQLVLSGTLKVGPAGRDIVEAFWAGPDCLIERERSDYTPEPREAFIKWFAEYSKASGHLTLPRRSVKQPTLAVAGSGLPWRLLDFDYNLSCRRPHPPGLQESLVTRRHVPLLPEVALETWAATLRPPARTALRRFGKRAMEVSVAELASAIAAHLEAVDEAQRSNEFIDLEKARSLAQLARQLTERLETLPPQRRIIAAAAILYFVTPDDAEDDLASSVGFDDDTEVLQSALRYLEP